MELASLYQQLAIQIMRRSEKVEHIVSVNREKSSKLFSVLGTLVVCEYNYSERHLYVQQYRKLHVYTHLETNMDLEKMLKYCYKDKIYLAH